MNKTIKIPKGYTPSKIVFTDGIVSMELEPIEPPKEFTPKDGDFCIATSKDGSGKWLFIYKKTEENNHRSYVTYGIHSTVITIDNMILLNRTITPATESEKQLLLSEIDKAGLIWNAEKKRIEKKRWRAEVDYGYLSLNGDGEAEELVEGGDDVDDNRHIIGNYFQTFKQAAEAAELIKELLFHFHEQDEILTKIKELLCANN